MLNSIQNNAKNDLKNKKIVKESFSLFEDSPLYLLLIFYPIKDNAFLN